MMRGKQSFSNLATVEDDSVKSGDTDNDSRSQHSNSMAAGSGCGAPKMKRSPYLSVMAGSTKSSEDLVAMLSRPTPAKADGGGLRRTSGGGTGLAGNPSDAAGASTFFRLKRPSSVAADNPLAAMMMPGAGAVTGRGSHTVTPVSSAGGVSDGGGDGDVEYPGTSATRFVGQEGGGGGGGGGAAAFRRSSSMANAGATRPMPSLRSALRLSSRGDLRSSTIQAAPAPEMKKNTSVTFSNTTKRASNLGMISTADQGQGNDQFVFPDQQQQQMGGVGGGGGAQNNAANLLQFQQQVLQQQQQQQSNYTASAMMKKSQSIAAPQFMLTHRNSSATESSSSANESFAQVGGDVDPNCGGSEAGGNTQFPIYLGNLPEKQAQQGAPTPRANPEAEAHVRRQSKSFHTLQYYYQNNSTAMDPAQKLLQAAGMTGMAPTRPSINGLNLTFRDMLDEGDGVDGDLNLRSRNQQWKDFRSFSDKFGENNPMMKAAAMMGGAEETIEEDGSAESDGTGATGTMSDSTNAAIPLSGSKRTLTPNSLGGSSNVSGASRNRAFLSGGAASGVPVTPALIGSHRAAVSVNDLAVLRRAAARMTMNNPSANNGPFTQRRESTKMAGETLGGDMLSRLNSMSSGGSSTKDPRDAAAPPSSNNTSLSPLAQMMAKNTAMKIPPHNGTNNRAAAVDGFASQSQRELFLQKFNNSLSGGGQMGRAGGKPTLSRGGMSSGRLNSGMGRRVQTVGAGLAYGHAGMSIDNQSGFRMSRFDLGTLRKETSRLSEISSADSGGRNEEWDL